MKTMGIILAAVVVIGLGWLVLKNIPAQPTTTINKLPNLKFEDLGGKQVALADFIGQPLVVNAWAVWCPFCVQELIDFAEVQSEFADQMTIIAINRAETKNTVTTYLNNLGIQGSLAFWIDKNDKFYQSIGGFTMPETIFINRDGKIVLHKRGPMSAEEIRSRINNLINS